MKIGFDIHGVIDTHPDKYRELINHLIEEEVEIHILTGLRRDKAEKILEEHKIIYDNLMCITDYHNECVIHWDDNGNPHMEEESWNKTKGRYCGNNNIDIMIDNSKKYGDYMPKGTIYLQQWK